MDNVALQTCLQTEALIRLAHERDTPVVLSDGDDECLVAMSPRVFEQILFGVDVRKQAEFSALLP